MRLNEYRGMVPRRGLGHTWYHGPACQNAAKYRVGYILQHHETPFSILVTSYNAHCWLHLTIPICTLQHPAMVHPPPEVRVKPGNQNPRKILLPWEAQHMSSKSERPEKVLPRVAVTPGQVGLVARRAMVTRRAMVVRNALVARMARVARKALLARRAQSFLPPHFPACGTAHDRACSKAAAGRGGKDAGHPWARRADYPDYWSAEPGGCQAIPGHSALSHRHTSHTPGCQATRME